MQQAPAFAAKTDAARTCSLCGLKLRVVALAAHWRTGADQEGLAVALCFRCLPA